MFRSLPTRLAWRELLSDKRRSALVLLLVGLPVAIASAVSVIVLGGLANDQDDRAGAMGEAAAVLMPLIGADGACLQRGGTYPGCEDRAKDAPAADFTPRPLADPGLPGVAEGMTTRSIAVQGIEGTVIVATVDVTNPIMHGRWRATSQPGADEVLALPAYLELMGLEPGDTVTVDGRGYRIAGVASLSPRASFLESGVPQLVVAPPHPLSGRTVDRRFLDSRPDDQQIAEYNRQGIGVATPDYFLDSGDAWQIGLVLTMMQAGACLVLGSVFASAFLIIMQSRQRSFALLRATGASVGAIRAIVWRTAVVFAVVGASVGASVGVAAGLGVTWAADRFGWWWVYGYRVGIVQVLMFIGVAVGMIALFSWWPARQVTRADVLEAMRSTEQASASPLRARWAIPPALASVACLAHAFSLPLFDGDGRTLPSQIERATVVSGLASLFAFIAMVIGFGSLLHRWGRNPRGPLALRIAVRDADRHRARTSGLLIATASVAALGLGLLMFVGAIMGMELATYHRRQPSDLVTISTSPFEVRGGIEAPTAAVESVLGAPVDRATFAEVLAENQTSTGDPDRVTVLARPDVGCSFRNPGMAGQTCSEVTDQSLIVAGEEYLRLILGDRAGPAIDGLTRGKVIVFDDGKVQSDGTVAYLNGGNGFAGDVEPSGFLPAAAVQSEAPFPPVISARAAREAGFTIAPESIILRFARPPTQRDVMMAESAMRRLNAGRYLDWDSGPVATSAAALPWVAGIFGAALVAVSPMGVGLVAGENVRTRTVLATLGARQRTLRAASVLHALIAVGLGVIAGALACVPMIAFMIGKASLVVIPWVHLASVLVIPVLIVALVAGLLTRSEPRRVIAEIDAG